MKRIISVFIALCLHVGAAHANSAAAFCSRYQGVSANVEILNAIGTGRARLVVACGVDINRPVPFSGKGITPLQLVASMGKPALIVELIALGADPNFAGDDEIKLYPLELALSTRKYETAKTLIGHGAQADYALPSFGTTALMALAFDQEFDASAVDVMKYLISHGASVHATDNNGYSPLHWAARAGNAKYVAVLLDEHADACMENKKAQRPAEVVIEKNQELKELLSAACIAPR